MKPADNPASGQRGQHSSSPRLLLLCFLLVLVFAFALSRVFWVPRPQVDLELLKDHITDPQQRKQAAWNAIDHPDAQLEPVLTLGLLGGEPDPDVRESYAYSLGRIGKKQYIPVLEIACKHDPAGIVRAAAWLAIARIDPDHFRRLAGTVAEPRTRWDAIGIAQGYLQAGDTRGVPKLLGAAEDGDHSQRIVAARALDRGLVPLMDSVGAWPIEGEVAPGQRWRADLLGAVRQRVAGLYLQRIADDLHQHERQTQRLRGNFRRILAAREKIAHLLFD